VHADCCADNSCSNGDVGDDGVYPVATAAVVIDTSSINMSQLTACYTSCIITPRRPTSVYKVGRKIKYTVILAQ